MRLLYIIFVQILLISVCLCKLSDNAKDRLLNGFVDYINNVPHQPYTYEEGVLISAQNTAVATYWIETRIKVSELHNIDVVKLLKCTGTVVDHGDNGITVQDDYRCIELPDDPNDFSSDLEELATDGPISTEGPEEWRPVQLDNEVQPNNAVSNFSVATVPPPYLCTVYKRCVKVRFRSKRQTATAGGFCICRDCRRHYF